MHCHQVRTLHFSPADCSLEVARLADLVDPSTRVVALGGAANSCGSTSDIRKAGGVVGDKIFFSIPCNQ